MKNSLEKTQQKTGITAYLSHASVRAQIEKAVGKNSDQFIASVISAVTVNPELQKCSSSSILSAALVGQSLRLSPSPQLGQYYMVPYNSKSGERQAQFQIGYRGMYQLAIRSGQFRKLNAIAVKEGELIRFDPVEEEIEIRLIEDGRERETAKTIGYYAYFELVNGFRKAMYWSREKMEAHAERYSMGYKAHKGYTFWERDFDSMGIKTMYRQLLKLAPMSIDMQKAIVSDEQAEMPDDQDYLFETKADDNQKPEVHPAEATVTPPVFG